jgi:hypothetical protein
MLGNAFVSLAFIRESVAGLRARDVGGTKSEDASSRKTGKTSAVTRNRTEV